MAKKLACFVLQIAVFGNKLQGVTDA